MGNKRTASEVLAALLSYPFIAFFVAALLLIGLVVCYLFCHFI